MEEPRKGDDWIGLSVVESLSVWGAGELGFKIQTTELGFGFQDVGWEGWAQGVSGLSELSKQLQTRRNPV